MDSLKSMKKRILEIAYKNKLSHLGSYFSCLPVIDEAYSKKNLDDVFVLSCGHAALALYVALEKRGRGIPYPALKFFICVFPKLVISSWTFRRRVLNKLIKLVYSKLAYLKVSS